ASHSFSFSLSLVFHFAPARHERRRCRLVRTPPRRRENPCSRFSVTGFLFYCQPVAALAPCDGGRATQYPLESINLRRVQVQEVCQKCGNLLSRLFAADYKEFMFL